MVKDETIKKVESKVPECEEEEFSFEIEELDSQHAMMMLIPLDLTTANGVHQSRP